MSEKTRVRNKSIKLRLFTEEKKILKDKSEKCNLSMEEYLRDMILFKNPVIRDRLNDIDADKIIYELNRIGNNINQIAYQSNLKCQVSKTDFNKLKEEYDKILELYVNEVLDR